MVEQDRLRYALEIALGYVLQIAHTSDFVHTLQV